MQAILRACLDSESPFINLNCTDANDFGLSPLLQIAKDYGLFTWGNIDIADKTALLLARGADVSQRDAEGNNCLHLVMCWLGDPPQSYIDSDRFSDPYDGLRDLLTLMITTGADIYAINEEGENVSEAAHAEGHWQIWAEVLETCGYDAEEVSQGYAADHGWSSGIDTPGTKPLAGCPLKLSFEAYLERREAERKAFRVTEIVDDETAEDDWVREFKEERRQREAAYSAAEEKDDDDDDDDDDEGDACQEKSSVSDDNKTTWEWDEASDLSTEKVAEEVMIMKAKKI
jgi:hypothetical protein